ncbi:MAG: FtsX-like permease family protein [Acidobacteria bacterium]|nr:FtsX-like permease family protein [Acidobacteriota bacterium]
MMRTLARLAWRDLRRSRFRALLIVASLAFSIAAIFGVRGAELVARRALEEDLRRWLGADVAATTGESLDGEVFHRFDAMRGQGVVWTWVTWTLAMARSDSAPDAVLSVVKVVDPEVYPLYPGIVLEPPQPLAAVLRDDAIVVSAEMLERLQARVGDRIDVAGHPFRISALLRSEADRLNGFAAIAPRLIVSRGAYERGGLAGGGNASKHSVLLRVPEGTDLSVMRRTLQAILPEAGVADYRESSQSAVSAVRVNIAFLGVTAFLVTMVGVVGLVVGVREHVQSQTPLIARLKILGAGTRQISTVFLMQVAVLLGCSLAMGLPLGLLARDAALWLAGKRIALETGQGVTPGQLAETLAVMALALLPVLPQPALLIRRVRPLEVLRGTSASSSTGSQGRWAGVAFVLLGLLGARLVGSWTSAVSLLAALAVSLGIAVWMADAAMGGLRRWGSGLRDCGLRLGLKNLSNPARGSRALVVALAMGLMLMIATYEVNRAVGQAIADALPFEGANLLVGGFEAEFRQTVDGVLRQTVGVIGEPQLVTQARLRLVSVDGVPVESLQKRKRPNAIPEAWRDIGCVGGAGVTISADAAILLGARVGSLLQFAGRSRMVERRVERIRKISRVEKFWYTFAMDCSGLEAASLHHLAVIELPRERLGAARREIAARFPMLAILTSDDVSMLAEDTSRDVLGLTRMVAWYAIAASLVVLAATVSASRGARLREIAVILALGATPRLVSRIHSVELAATGALAALIGGVLSCGFLSVALSVTFERVEVALGWRGVAAAMVGAVLFTVLAGWLPVRRWPRRRPLESLREE